MNVVRDLRVGTNVGRGTSSEVGVAVPKVSVATITYMHEEYIADTIEGVLAQDVDFGIEHVIGEDCSTDRTREVIRGYMERHPGLIRLSDYGQNVGAGHNFRTTFARCRGEYIAFVDGDDYWTAPDKLRRQVELLDANPDLALCFHAVEYRHQDGRSRPFPVYPPGRRPRYRLADLSRWLRLGPSSMMFRRSALPAFPTWHQDVFFGDWALMVILAESGDIGYIDEVMGVKRLQPDSVLFGNGPSVTEHLRNMAHQHAVIGRHLGPERGLPFARQRDRCRYRLAHAYLADGERERAWRLFRETFREVGLDPRVTLREPALSLLHFFAPAVYRALRCLWRNSWHRTAWHRGGLQRDGT